MNTNQAAPLTLDRSDVSATLELYRAALGPIQVDDYLKTFTRFDAAGKVSPSWNWGAALLTLNWMAFRRLWGPALAYVGASTAACLLLFGILPLVYPMSHAGLWTMLALTVLVAVAVPGAFGNAWLYAACNKAMNAAYSASATQEEACALLRKSAVGRPRLGGLAAGNVALLAAVTAIVLSWPSVGSLPLNSSRMEQARMQAPSIVTAAASEPAAAPTAAASAPTMQPVAIASAASAPLATASAAASASVAAASQPTASRSSQGLLQMPAPIAAAAPISPAAPAAPIATAADNAAKAKAAAKQKSDSALAAAAEQQAAALASRRAAQDELASRRAAKEIAVRKAVQEETASRIAAKEEQVSRKAQAAKAAKAEPATQTTDAAKAAKATTVAKVIKPAAPASAAGAESYLINVGLFADANNARNAYTKLMDAGLPAQSLPFSTSKGQRTRVRVGPFESRAEADTAADKIHALALDAVVFKP